MKIGVLALQGAVREHIRHIELSGHEGIAVKKVEQLEEIEGLILPGGESTTLRRLMNLYGFKEALQNSTLPMFGTCAGLIVLAQDIVGEEGYLNKLNITVQRNSFGRQVDSFETELDIKGIATDIEGVFIRAPHIEKVDWILPIAGIIAAIAFLILCIGIVAVLNSVKKNLDYVAKTLDGVEVKFKVLLVKQQIYFIK